MRLGVGVGGDVANKGFVIKSVTTACRWCSILPLRELRYLYTKPTITG